MAGQATVKKVMKTLGTEGTKGIVNQAVNANPELAHALVDNDVAAYAVGEGSNEVLIYDDNDSIIKIGQIITNYQPYMNTFVPALVNQIGMVAIERMMWMNKWSKFYQASTREQVRPFRKSSWISATRTLTILPRRKRSCSSASFPTL